MGNRPSILVFTEGKKTEPIYLLHWSRAYRENVIITIDDFHGTPLTLVQEAAARRTADLRAARRGHGNAYSEYWCVFDIDEHPHVDRALDLAAASGISVAVSNPCIELWFLLHFQEQNAAIHRHDAQRKATELSTRLRPLNYSARQSPVPSGPVTTLLTACCTTTPGFMPSALEISQPPGFTSRP